jgi:hypothetical protein
LPPIRNTVRSVRIAAGNGGPAIPITRGGDGRAIPAVVEHNRQKQRVRDQKRRLRDLANNNALAWMRFLPDKGKRTVLSTEQINDLHRLYWSEHWPIP